MTTTKTTPLYPLEKALTKVQGKKVEALLASNAAIDATEEMIRAIDSDSDDGISNQERHSWIIAASRSAAVAVDVAAAESYLVTNRLNDLAVEIGRLCKGLGKGGAV